MKMLFVIMMGISGIKFSGNFFQFVNEWNYFFRTWLSMMLLLLSTLSLILLVFYQSVFF